MEPDDSCIVCKLPGTQKCLECNLVSFCGNEHRTEAWKTHQEVCRPFKVQTDEKLGRHLIATRAIRVGEVILQEPAMTKGPAQTTAPVCLGCYKLLSPETSRPCLRCGWPMCSILCQESPDHVPECTYTVDKGNKVSVTNFIFPHPIYKCLFVLRCLYQKENDAELWAKLMKLQSHCDERRTGEKYENDRITIAQFIRKFFKQEDKFTEEEILQVCGIVQVNGHEIPLTEPAHVAIYEETSMFEHNCRPNCCKSFTSDGDVLITAGTQIAAGDHLSICYTDSLWGSQNRRHYLAETKHFLCSCERCSDPTEFGTYFSAVKCQKTDCTGYVLPETFLVNPHKDMDQPWHCNNCNNKLTSLGVQNVLERIGHDLEAMQKGDPKSCQLFLDYYGKKLHHNHYYLTDVRLALSQLIGQEAEDGLTLVTDDELQMKCQLCKEIVDLVKKLNPAEFRVQGVQMFELHATLAEMARRRTASGEMGTEQLTALLLESKRILEESIELLKNEPEELPEGKIAIQAERNLYGLENLLRTITTNVGICPI